MEKFKILGVGSPMVDFLIQIDEDFFAQNMEDKGGTKHLTFEAQDEILEKINHMHCGEVEIISGGAAGNTIRALANLGCDVAFLAVTGKDELAEIYRAELAKAGVDLKYVFANDHAQTDRCLSFITPDSERTFRSFLGASLKISASDVALIDFSEFQLVYIEGYQLYNLDFCLELIKKAKEAGVKIAIDLSSFEAVKTFKNELITLFEKRQIDLVFANLDEMLAFEVGSNVEELLNYFKKFCSVVAIKLGANGALVAQGSEIYHGKGCQVKAIDTTGAGDLWASGFLYGYINNLELQKATDLANFIGSEIVQNIGTNLNKKQWSKIHDYCKKITGENMKYKIKDINLAHFGRQEIAIAEHEMPGLMVLRSKYQANKPLAGVKISGSLHMTIQTAVLIETLKALGADIRWASCNIFSTQDHAAAAIAEAGVPVFAWKGETLQEYWECTLEALTFPDGSGPNQIVDDGGDATLLIHRGFAAENNPAILDEPTDNAELQVVNALLKSVLAKDAQHWHKVVKGLKGVSEETTTGVHRLLQMEKRGELLVQAINVNDAVTKSKFDNIYGCRHSLTDGIKRALDVMLSGKTAMVCGFGDVGKGCAEALHNERSRILVSEIDPICALQACMAGYKVCTIEDALSEADLYVTTTGNCNIITLEHMAKMRDQAIVCNIGHFDNEIEVAKLDKYPGVIKEEIKGSTCPVHKYTFADGHSIYLLAEGRLVNLGCATGHPSFVMSNSFCNQTLAQIDIANNPDRKVGVYLIDKKLDEEVARLHLAKLGAKLTKLTQEQADYIGVEIDGPYKSQEYRY